MTMDYHNMAFYFLLCKCGDLLGTVDVGLSLGVSDSGTLVMQS